MNDNCFDCGHEYVDTVPGRAEHRETCLENQVKKLQDRVEVLEEQIERLDRSAGF